MMASITRTVMVLLAAGPLAVAVPAAAQDREDEPSGPVIVQIDPATADRGGEVKVIRGSAMHPEPVARTFSSKAVPNGGAVTVGADTLWIVDRKAGVATGCVLAATIVAGDMFDIRCETQRLP